MTLIDVFKVYIENLLFPNNNKKQKYSYSPSLVIDSLYASTFRFLNEVVFNLVSNQH